MYYSSPSSMQLTACSSEWLGCSLGLTPAAGPCSRCSSRMLSMALCRCSLSPLSSPSGEEPGHSTSEESSFVRLSSGGHNSGSKRSGLTAVPSNLAVECGRSCNPLAVLFASVSVWHFPTACFAGWELLSGGLSKGALSPSCFSSTSPPLVSCPPEVRLWPVEECGLSQAELWMTLRDPDSCLMVRRSAPLLLERYVFRPGGLSECRAHAGGEGGLPEASARPEGTVLWCNEALRKDIRNDSVKRPNSASVSRFYRMPELKILVAILIYSTNTWMPIITKACCHFFFYPFLTHRNRRITLNV